MKHYFMTAKEVGNLTRIVCASLEEKSIKKDPTVMKFWIIFCLFEKRQQRDKFLHKEG